jgi:hypothetical protein
LPELLCLLCSGRPEHQEFYQPSITQYNLPFDFEKTVLCIFESSFGRVLGTESEYSRLSVVDTRQVQEPVLLLLVDVLMLKMPTTVHAFKHIIFAVDPGLPGELHRVGPGEYPLPHVSFLFCHQCSNRDTNRKRCVDAAVKRMM